VFPLSGNRAAGILWSINWSDGGGPGDLKPEPPCDGRNPQRQRITPRCGSHHLRDLLTPAQDWLLEQARGPKVQPRAGHKLNAVELRFLAKVWLDELARRRSIWCWNIFEGYSNALWSLYGSRGVAIHSTIGQVKP
jgi:hypothetical protein